jgi:hypothetical protein
MLAARHCSVGEDTTWTKSSEQRLLGVSDALMQPRRMSVVAKRTTKPKPSSNLVRKRKSAGAKSAGKKRSTGSNKRPAMPSMLVAEQVMSGLFGGGKDPAFHAQQLAYDAMEALDSGDIDQAVGLAIQAVEVDPNCIDARMLLAQVDCRDGQTFLAETKEIVECGERALGKKFFKENAGYFWGLLETRPYMRARASLAEQLASAGRREEAIGHYEDMLRLNPGDNQGLRYALLGQYLVLGNLDCARQLFEQYPDEWSAFFAWGRVLERFTASDLEGASAALQAAREHNRHVEKYLTGKKKVPKNSPGFYSPGEDNEAVICMREIGEAWQCQPGAIEWLKKQRPTAK